MFVPDRSSLVKGIEWVKDRFWIEHPDKFNSSMGRIAKDSKSVDLDWTAESLLSLNLLNSRKGKLHPLGRDNASSEKD